MEGRKHTKKLHHEHAVFFPSQPLYTAFNLWCRARGLTETTSSLSFRCWGSWICFICWEEGEHFWGEICRIIHEILPRHQTAFRLWVTKSSRAHNMCQSMLKKRGNCLERSKISHPHSLVLIIGFRLLKRWWSTAQIKGTKRQRSVARRKLFIIYGNQLQRE